MDAAAWLDAGRNALAALPFLPRGKGPEILMMGGLTSLGMSMVWSIIRSARNVPRRSATASRPATPLQTERRGSAAASAALPAPPYDSLSAADPTLGDADAAGPGGTTPARGAHPPHGTAAARPTLDRGDRAHRTAASQRTAAGRGAASAWADEWLGALGDSLGPCEVLSSAPHRVVVRLSRCPSCRQGGPGGPGGHGGHGGPTRRGPCATARRDLQRVASAAGWKASVHEASCRFGGKPSCTFVVERDG